MGKAVFREAGGGISGQGSYVSTSEAETIRQLKRENERLKMERDILKKVMAIFSGDPK
jgi:transposase